MKRLVTMLVVVVVAVVLAIPAGAITGGQNDGNGHPNVGLLGYEARGVEHGFCSGTLIAPTVFLTAGHCTAALLAAGIQTVWVSFDPSFDPALSVRLPVASLHAAFTPDYSIKGFDIGVAILAQPVAIEPATLAPLGVLDALQAAGTLRDAAITSVGYGRCGRETGGGPPTWCAGGDRRYVQSPIMALNANWLRLQDNDGGTCFGDSGGPHFLDGEIVAITTGGDATCAAYGVSFRIDTPAARSFLAPFASG